MQSSYDASHNGRRKGRGASRAWYLLLILPYLAMIWVSSYNSAEPAFAGIPFFYWYQLLWIWIGAGLTLIVYFATRDRSGDDPPRDLRR